MRESIDPREVVRFLLGSLRLINVYGWTRNGLGNTAVGYSLMGAFDRMYTHGEPAEGVWTLCFDYAEYSSGSSDLWSWHETVTTVDVIMELLARGAERPELVFKVR